VPSASKSKDDSTPGKLTDKLSNVYQNLKRKEKHEMQEVLKHA
jgi:hypothetical protein